MASGVLESGLVLGYGNTPEERCGALVQQLQQIIEGIEPPNAGCTRTSSYQ